MNRLAATMKGVMELVRRGNLAEATDAIRLKLSKLSGLLDSTDNKKYDNTAAVDRAALLARQRAEVPATEGIGTFTKASYTCRAGSRNYKVFTPAADNNSPLPLVVMLHGCTQTADDFAVGTGMNELAAAHRCVIVYPEQASSANSMKCWNWFNSSDQQRDRGEPAIIAGITQEVIATYGLDPSRVYVAGLSAGGAMAVVMGRTYPDLYAAVGVHSGIPYAIAHDATSAFAAMKGTTTQPRSSATSAPRLIPTIVLHGDQDKTVHPCNGEKLAHQYGRGDGSTEMAVSTENGWTTIDSQPGIRGRAYTRTRLRDESGKVVVEYWLVHGAGHAWFGGNPLGSHTDPTAPDASQEILRFCLEHELMRQQS